MKLGVLRTFGVWDVDAFVADVARARKARISSYWIPNLGVAVDSLMALAVAGREVPDIELGAGIVPTWTRHPLATAQSALTASSLVGSRLSVGVGLVHEQSVARNWGLKWDRPVTHAREYLEILGTVLDNEEVDYAGEVWTARAGPLLPGAARPGLYLAAMGRQMLAVAGRHSDGTILWLTGPRTVRDHVIPTITAAALAAGRPRPRILAGIPVLVTDDVATGRALAAHRFSRYATLPSYVAMMEREGGTGPEDLAVIGDEAAVRGRFEEFFASGVDDVLCAEFGDTEADVERTRDCLADLSGA